MMTWISRSLFILNCFVFAEPGFAAAGNQDQKAEFNYPLKQAPAAIRVQGTSTLGHWDCSQNAISGSAKVNISAKRLREKIADVWEGDSDESSRGIAWDELNSQIAVSIDANGFDCDNGRMKRDLMDAIRANEHPSIKYWFTRVEAVSVLRDDEEAPYLELKVHGDLLFGGERRETVHTSQLWLDEDASIQVKGSLILEMSDFGIKPPTALFGLIRADDHFQVEYHIKIKTKDPVGSEQKR